MDNLVVRGLLVGVVILLVAAACWRAPLWQWIAAASAGSLLVAPHVYGYDAGLLLLSIWLAIFMSTEQVDAHRSHAHLHAHSISDEPGRNALGRRHARRASALSRQPAAARSEPRVPDVRREVPSLAESHPLV